MNSEKIQRDRKIRVLVADSARIHTRLLADALQSDPSLEVIPFESDSSALIRAALDQNIDVLVISSTLEDHPSRGFEILQDLRSAQQQIRSVVLLGSNKDELILKAFRAGARGIFSKNDAVELLGECVRAIYQGKVWANSHALAVAIDALASAPAVRTENSNGMNLLSKRELQVVRSLAEGLTNREIAEQLKLSPHTIKNYLFRIFDKLGVSSRIELLFMALSQPETGVASNRIPGMSEGIQLPTADSALLEKSAEAGLPAAQLALAQLHFSRGRDPKDLVEAYMWYVVATERALMARGQITKMLTPEQIEEAKHKATVRLSRLQRLAADSPVPGSSTALSSN